MKPIKAALVGGAAISDHHREYINDSCDLVLAINHHWAAQKIQPTHILTNSNQTTVNSLQKTLGSAMRLQKLLMIVNFFSGSLKSHSNEAGVRVELLGTNVTPWAVVARDDCARNSGVPFTGTLGAYYLSMHRFDFAFDSICVFGMDFYLSTQDIRLAERHGRLANMLAMKALVERDDRFILPSEILRAFEEIEKYGSITDSLGRDIKRTAS
jgi:hypothetical protein